MSLSYSELARLTEKAKNELRQGAEAPRRNVFISFSSEDLAEVNLLRGQAKNSVSELEFNDWSLREPFDSERAEYIRGGIRERIRQSSVTLVYVSASTSQSKWVDWEIRESIKMGKGVIAVYKGDSPPPSLPKALGEIGVVPISWTHAGIMQEIERVERGG